MNKLKNILNNIDLFSKNITFESNNKAFFSSGKTQILTLALYLTLVIICSCCLRKGTL